MDRVSDAVSELVEPRGAGELPLIGVTTSEIRPARTISPRAEGEPVSHEMAIGLNYIRAIEEAGGLPVAIPPLRLDAIEPLLGRFAGLCLPGGPDIDPAQYGQPPDPSLGDTEPALDRFELAVARAARERELPLLAICRGAQVLNVARGGTLIQHLPDLVAEDGDEEVAHRQSTAGNRPSHPIRIEAGSRTASAFGGTAGAVNSFHHQGIERLGGELRATAWAADGTIEAIEGREDTFTVGVQWHAELMSDRPEERRLFADLVEAAGRRAGRAEEASRAPR